MKMRRLKIFMCVWVLGFGVALSEGAVGQDLANSGNMSLDAASYVEGFAANLDAIRRGDCMLVHEVFADSGPGGDYGAFEEWVAYTRITFDRDKNRWFFVQDIRGNRGDYASDGRVGDVLEARQLQGFCSSEQGTVVRRGLDRAGDVTSSLEELAKSFSMPRLFAIGLVPWGQFADDQAVARKVAVLTSGATRASVSPPPSAPADRRRVTFEFDHASGGVTALVYTFDTEALVPIKWVTESRRKDKAGEIKRNIVSEQSFQWEERNGLQLPTKVVRSKQRSFRQQETGKLSLPTERVLITQIHWFSVNEPIADERFLPERMYDLDDLAKTVDPEKSGISFE